MKPPTKNRIILILFILSAVLPLGYYASVALGQEKAKAVAATPVVELPVTISATKEASLSFQNHLLSIQLLRAQAEALTARADQMQGLVPDKVKATADESKIDLTLYKPLRDKDGRFVTDDEGRLQFTLIVKKKE